ncbi:hypothetical protein BZB76_0976 [Actinomadura pelletieri DSM 43383]|uniref:Uncharacterized protein n=1 Tax=Actinomadura pelletieri DSM 43383 TaxID=1120940 RepID=A0A495R075_9ACTN|nr:hypothetical protein [Actinomadura pelletieri]RKS79506.1 hypothetical protein BZB76_0976 [Actinomadura pelletieri DSM 43383]
MTRLLRCRVIPSCWMRTARLARLADVAPDQAIDLIDELLRNG